MRDDECVDVWESVFMVREVSFGANFTPKLFISIVTIGLVAWDVTARRRWDYVWVFLTGTVLWTLVELSLQIRGTRVMTDHLLFGHGIPLALSAPLQGIAEGAAVGVVALFVADRLLDPVTRGRALLAVALGMGMMWLLMAMQAAATVAPASAASRRDMTVAGTAVFAVLIVAFDAWFWFRRPAFRHRFAAMALVMLTLATVWTIASVTTGGRWVEVPGTTPGTFVAAPAIVAFAAFGFDIVIEIVLAYLPFFSIPVLLGLIRPSATPSAPGYPISAAPATTSSQTGHTS